MRYGWTVILAVSALLTACGTTEVAGIAAPESTTEAPPLTTTPVLAPLATLSTTTPTLPPEPPPITPAATAPPRAAPGPPAPPRGADPAGVVGAFFSAVNARDYRRAWDLGGRNLAASYDTFATGFVNTARVDITVSGVAGPTVTVQLHATNTDGSKQNFNASYTVSDGAITAASQVAVP